MGPRDPDPKQSDDTASLLGPSLARPEALRVPPEPTALPLEETQLEEGGPGLATGQPHSSEAWQVRWAAGSRPEPSGGPLLSPLLPPVLHASSQNIYSENRG